MSNFDALCADLDSFLEDDEQLDTIDTSRLDDLAEDFSERTGPYGKGKFALKQKKESRSDAEERAAAESLDEIRRIAAGMQMDVGQIDSSAKPQDVQQFAMNLVNSLSAQQSRGQERLPAATSSPFPQAGVQTTNHAPANKPSSGQAYNPFGATSSLYSPGYTQTATTQPASRAIQAPSSGESVDDLLAALAAPAPVSYSSGPVSRTITAPAAADDLESLLGDLGSGPQSTTARPNQPRPSNTVALAQAATNIDDLLSALS